jgi:ABC-type branched-subunit amino acid transport system ATPase component
MTAALQVEGLNRAFGALPVTRDVNLTLERGARRALIGPNGAGKTTLVNLITGVLKPHSGRVLLDGAAGSHAPFRSISFSAGSRCSRIFA